MKLAAFHLIRALERTLPLPALRACFWPLVQLASLRERRLQREMVALLGNLPAEYRAGPALAQDVASESQRRHFSRFMSFWPDRYNDSPWRERIDVGQFSRLPRDQPLVLATLHSGRTFFMHYALRAQDFRAATFIGLSAEEFSQSKRRKGALARGEGPVVFFRNQLTEASRHIRRGNALIIALDKPSDAMETVDFGGIPIQLSTGGVRLALMNNALIVACLLLETGPWQYQFYVGEPFQVTSTVEIPEALARLANDLAPPLMRCPQQWSWETLDCLRRANFPINS